MWQPTCWPGCTPTDRKWWASLLARASSSRKVSRRPSAYSASRSGTWSTMCSNMSARLNCMSVLEPRPGGGPTVDGELGTRDVRRSVARQERDCLRHLLRLARSLHRDLPAHPRHVVVVRDEVPHHRGVDATRVDAVDADAIGRQLDGGRLRHPSHRELACGVGDEEAVATKPLDAAEV